MSQEYWNADEVEDLVRVYMKFHPELVGAKIACVFKEKASKSDGVPIVGKISKVSPSNHPLMKEEYDFKIEIGSDAWLELNPTQREAWVDHLLEHAYGVESETTGDMSWKLRNPELMGFPSIINRHGIGWMPGLSKIPTLQLNATTTATPPVVKTSTTTDIEEDLD